MSPTGRPVQEPPTRLFLLMLVGITALGPMAMQMFLPALPAVQDSFNASPATVQLTLSLSMLSIAGSTLIYGPFSDRYGRRPVLIVGLVLYLAGSALCALAPSIWFLVAARIVQAGGSAAGLVLARAIVRDVYPDRKVASVLAYLTMAMVVGPMVAPLIGGLLTDFIGWRANFVFSGLIGLAVGGLVLAGLHETATRATSRASAAGMLASFIRLLRSPRFCGYVLQGAFSSGTFFAFISAAPYVMVKVMGRPATEYGLYFVLLALAYMVGNFVAARTSHKVGLDRMIVLGSVLALAGTLLSLVLALNYPWTPMLIFGPGIVIGVANGLSMPNAQAGAVSHDPDAAGTASGLSGFLQMTIAAIFAQAVGSVQDGTPYPMIGFMVAGAALALLSIVLGLRPGRRRPSGL